MKSIIVGTLFLTFTALFGCNTASSNKEDNPTAVVYQKTPEELRAELKMQEQANPRKYLEEKTMWRKNFWGEAVLEVDITNKATLANFKDVILEVTWLTKTETEINTERYPIYEYVPAGKSIHYKIKADAPKSTGNIRVTIYSATPVN